MVITSPAIYVATVMIQSAGSFQQCQ